MKPIHVLAPLALAAASPLSAQEQTGDADGSAPAEWSFYAENDLFDLFGDNSDSFYTNGLRLERMRERDAASATILFGIEAEAVCRIVCNADASGVAVATGWAVGQNIYTPENARIAEPQPNDRPWAGLLYYSSMVRMRYRDPDLNVGREDKVEISLGVTGPPSLAEAVQRSWHTDVLGIYDPAGWDNQIKTEPIFQIGSHTALRLAPNESEHFDFIPRLKANLGNAKVSLEGEAKVRAGVNLRGFGADIISVPVASPYDEPVERPSELVGRGKPMFAVFLRGGMKAVAHDILLDGNTFANNDIRIDRRPFVPEWAAGFEFEIGALRFAYQYIERGSEFETRNGTKGGRHKFGSFTVGLTTRR